MASVSFWYRRLLPRTVPLSVCVPILEVNGRPSSGQGPRFQPRGPRPGPPRSRRHSPRISGIRADNHISCILREAEALLALGNHRKAGGFARGDAGHGVLDAAARRCGKPQRLERVQVKSRDWACFRGTARRWSRARMRRRGRTRRARAGYYPSARMRRAPRGRHGP